LATDIFRFAGLAVAAAILAGCASGPRGFSGRDGSPSNPPAGLSNTPDAEPRIEPIRASGGTSKPYTVMGRTYAPITDDRPFHEYGLASWYGKGFHELSTASGEPYDMYAMTAAHKTLPLPSYVWVRNPANGRQVIVRVNDRGPFRDDRIIDLSYTAALKLGLLRGVAPVEIDRITNEDIRTGAWRRPEDTQFAAAAPAGEPPPAGPALWAAPAANPSPRAPGILLAQAGPASDTLLPVMSDNPAPPPRFGDMQAQDLAPLAPVPAPLPAPPPSPVAGAVPAAASSAAASTSGVWLQLGAFHEAAGAQSLQARAAQSVPALTTQLHVFSEAGTHRLQAGPFPSRAAAQAMAGQISSSLGIAPLVVDRR
jgi:rare lipoprotein A